jgi:hypothetical protein
MCCMMPQTARGPSPCSSSSSSCCCPLGTLCRACLMSALWRCLSVTPPWPGLMVGVCVCVCACVPAPRLAKTLRCSPRPCSSCLARCARCVFVAGAARGRIPLHLLVLLCDGFKGAPGFALPTGMLAGLACPYLGMFLRERDASFAPTTYYTHLRARVYTHACDTHTHAVCFFACVRRLRCSV